MTDAIAQAIAALEPFAGASQHYTGDDPEHIIRMDVGMAVKYFRAASAALALLRQGERSPTREDVKRAILTAVYGSPSSRGGKNPPGWHLDRDCSPSDAAMHDNGCMDALKAVLALFDGQLLPTPPKVGEGIANRIIAAEIEPLEREIVELRRERDEARLAYGEAKEGGALWVDTAQRHQTALSAERAKNERLRAIVSRLANARALAGVREIVAGWNGEGKPDGPYERHQSRLGATLPKTDCGAVYELDEALTDARLALAQEDGKPDTGGQDG